MGKFNAAFLWKNLNPDIILEPEKRFVPLLGARQLLCRDLGT